MADFSWLKQLSPGAAKMMEQVKRTQAQSRPFVPFAPGTPVRRAQAPQVTTAAAYPMPTHKTQAPQTPAAYPAPGKTGDTERTETPEKSSGLLGREAGQVTRNFHINEFRCKGTGTVQMSGDVIRRLQQLRDHLGVAITVTSGYRSPEHNRAVKGAPGSLHTKGLAADIAATGISAGRLAAAAKQFFPTAVAYSGHVHVDVGPARSW